MSIRNYGRIESVEELSQLFEQIENSPVIGFDIETGYHGPDREKGAIHPETAIVVGFSFTDSEDWARYVPLNHDEGENLTDHVEVARLLWQLLNRGTGVAHNAPFELRHLAKFFRDLLSDDPEFGDAVKASKGYYPIRSDTMVEAYLMAEYQKFGLKLLTKELFDHTMTELHQLFPGLAQDKRKFLRFNTLPISPEVIEYACEDALWCLKIHARYYEQVKQDRRLLYETEMDIVTKVTPYMEDHGVPYDWAAMRTTADQLRLFRDRYNAEIMDDFSRMLGEPVAINLGSPPQVGRVLYERLGYRTTVYTATTRNLPYSQRKMSTGAIALKKLADENPVVKKVLNWKEINKLLGTYLDKYEKKFNYAEDGYAHPNHLNAFVVTGRFAVSDPPYQGCLDGYQCVLTLGGWQRLDKLADGVAVAQYTEAGELEFVIPEVVRNPYYGDMIELGSSEGGTWRYTPNHRIVYRMRKPRGDRGLTEVRECTAEEWEARLLKQKPGPQGRRLHDRRYPKAGIRIGGHRLTDAERRSLRLAVACQADGTLSRSGGPYAIRVFRQRKIDAFGEMGIQPRRSYVRETVVKNKKYSGTCHEYVIRRDDVGRWLDDSMKKNFRPEAILALCAEDLRWFVDEIMQWDGDSTRGCTYQQKVTRRQSVDVVQAAAALCGYATSLYEQPERGRVTVNVWDRTHKEAGWQTVRRSPSSGMVYCLTVPSGMFLCRNDQGKVLVTGNSPKKYHYDLREASELHAEHAEAHGKKCKCREFDPPPGTCFQFNFRDCIVAPPGHYILGFDLSQAELRAIAGEAQEESLLKAFANGEDVHKLTASLMLSVPFEEITDSQRDIGKTMNFALLYGMGVKSLADRLGISIEAAEVLMNKYFAGFPAIAAWSAKQRKLGHEQGFVTSRFGRKLPIWEFKSEFENIQKKGDRACVNYPIQGAATGDTMKIAMVRVMEAIRDAGLEDKIHLMMNIHDALEFAVHSSVVPEKAIALLKPAVIFDIPGWPQMEADWHIAKRWGSPSKVLVKADGGLSVQHTVEYEVRPRMEVDEDSGETIYEMPEVEPEVMRQAVQRRLVLKLVQSPTPAEFQSLVALINRTPGDNTLTFSFPDGHTSEWPGGTCGLTPHHLGKVSAILGPIAMSYDGSDMDITELISGIKTW